MDEESSVQLLLNPDNKKKTDLSTLKNKKFQQSRAANALFCGLILGFIFSFLVAYSGVIIDDNRVITTIDYSASDFIIKSNATELEPSKNKSFAEFLYHEVRVLCFILPMSKQALDERGDIFLKTWTKRCHKFIFFTDEPDPRYTENVVVLQYKDNNWSRLREALSYIYKHHLNDFDWILKANDNSYIILENLRWLLYQYDTDWPLIIGQRFLAEDYMVGTYAISKRAFTRLIENGFTNGEICNQKGSDDDKEISKCLQHLNVIQVDALDDEGKGMFFQNNPESALFPDKIDADYDKWWWHKLKQGPSNCCSDRMVAVQHVLNTHLYYMEYFIYKVHAFGRHRLPEPLPRKKSLEEIVKEKF